MFNKDKKSSDMAEITETIDRLQYECKTLRETVDEHRNTLNTFERTATYGYTIGSTATVTSPSYVSLLDFEKVTHMLDVIYNEITSAVPHSDGVDIIARALDGFQCPVEECKRCRYYLPGSVDSCDRTRALAAHLLESGTVRIVPPKHIDKAPI